MTQESKEINTIEDSWFSKKRYLAKFGRYVGDRHAEESVNEFMVGREKQRSKLLQLLSTMTSHGVYLISGHRGSGKTRFVLNCLNEYQDSLYERFLRKNVGKTMFWDKILLLFIIAVLTLIPLFASELIKFILAQSPSLEESNSTVVTLEVFHWLLVIPLAFICLLPFLYARKLFEVLLCNMSLYETTLKVFPSREKGFIHLLLSGVSPYDYKRHIAVFSSYVIALLLAGIIFCFGSFGSVTHTMSCLYVSLCWIYFIHRSFCIDYQTVTKEEMPTNSWCCFNHLGRYLWIALTSAIALVPFVSYLINIDITDCFFISGKDHDKYPLQHLCFGGFLLALGNFIKFMYPVIYWTYKSFRNIPTSENEPEVRFDNLIFAIFLLCITYHFSPEINPTPFGYPLRYFYLIFLAWLPLLFLVRDAKKKSFYYSPRPRLTIFIKGTFFLILSLQLVLPLLSHTEVKSYLPRTVVGINLAHCIVTDDIFEEAFRPPMSLYDVAMASKESFSRKLHESFWILGVLTILYFLAFIEFGMVVKPIEAARRIRNEAPGTIQEKEFNETFLSSKETCENFIENTIFWNLYKRWLPVAVVRVNLGFDDLNYKRVIDAMLTGLQQEYNRHFLKASSPMMVLRRIFFILFLILLTTVVSPHFLGTHNLGWISKDSAYKDAGEKLQIHYYCKQMIAVSEKNQEMTDKGIRDYNLLETVCSLGNNKGIINLLYWDVLPIPNKSVEDSILFYFLPHYESEVDGEKQFIIKFHLHYFLLMFTLFWVLRWLQRWMQLFPYNEVGHKIRELLDSLSSRMREENKSVSFNIKGISGSIGKKPALQIKDSDPQHPRSIEIRFIDLLSELQNSKEEERGRSTHTLNFPTPEVIFVFDELDKIGSRINPELEEDTSSINRSHLVDEERRRSLAVNKLLADMKNLLSTANARFIFIGGRDLHDEWHADQTSRSPLLTSIFNAEIYLPSLLTDHSVYHNATFTHRIRLYLNHQFHRARILHTKFMAKRDKRIFALLPERQHPISFTMRPEMDKRLPLGPALATQEEWEKGEKNTYQNHKAATYDKEKLGFFLRKPLERREELKLLNAETTDIQLWWSNDFLISFQQFLAYRSMGNPKQLKEILENFIRPATQVTQSPGIYKNCQHVIFFEDNDKFRIQLVSDMYRHLTGIFEEQMVRGDDKLVMSIFYFADFICKFHRSAFSWSSLELVDELVYIHRAPAVRTILKKVVHEWTGRYLHPIRNGVFDYRFRGSFSSELKYASIISEEELAAFNFTLDESQALKQRYQVQIKELEKKTVYESEAALAELYGFDEEYEVSRYHYRQAIQALDKELQDAWMMQGPGEKIVALILKSMPEGLEAARRFITWGIMRLRIMLKIGMTYELSNNLERAQIEYRDARTLSRSLIRALLDEKGRLFENTSQTAIWDLKGSRTNTLVDLAILFHPIFAHAWVSEKMVSGVDTGPDLMENQLWQVRHTLPFVRKRNIAYEPNDEGKEWDRIDRGFSNFALIAAELHNRAGDLYFFKGRQLGGLPNKDSKSSNIRQQAEGYLLAAFYHYVVSLHEVRRYNYYRIESSQVKYFLKNNIKGNYKQKTIKHTEWPNFVYQAATGSMVDLAETIHARISLSGLIHDIAEIEVAAGTHNIEESIISTYKTIQEWLVSCHESKKNDYPRERCENLVFKCSSFKSKLGHLSSWFGFWNLGDEELETDSERYYTKESRDKHLITFVNAGNKNRDNVFEMQNDLQRLLMSLLIKCVTSEFNKDSGELDSAAEGYITVAETIENILWSYASVQFALKAETPQSNWKKHFRKCKKSSDTKFKNFLDGLLEVAVYALQRANDFYERGDKNWYKDETKRHYPLSNHIPAIALTTACSLGLVYQNLNSNNKTISLSTQRHGKSLSAIVDKWIRIPVKKSDPNSPNLDYKGALIKSLERHSYPVHNRLRGLKVLIDNAVLEDKKESEKTTILEHLKELLELQTKYESPIYFTPYMSGITLALVKIWLNKNSNSNKSIDNFENLEVPALDHLTLSQEMYTLGRGYYDIISGLYYFYDDFNGRELHFNRSIQMSGSELTSLMIEIMEKIRETKD